MNVLKVGDRISIKGTFNDYVVTITRVTKTQAIGEGIIKGSSVIQRFKLEYGAWLNPLPRIKWSQTTYTLL